MDQPTLPIHEDPRTVEYFPDSDDGTAWTVNDWPSLKEAFSLDRRELETWHSEFAGQGRPWTVIKRIFGVMAVFGDAVEDEDEESWDWKKLAKRIGVSEAELREDLQAAVSFWKKQKLARRIQPAGRQEAAAHSIEAMKGFAIAQKLEESEVSHLLNTYRFHTLKGDDRLFAANRIMELRSIFEDPNRREQARQLIVMELNVQDNEATRALLKSRLSTLSSKADRGDLTDKESAEIQKIRESLDSNEASHTRLFEKYRSAASELGAEEMEQGELRKVALGTASQWIESHRQYYATGDRSLIDGMFTADELVWLTTPIPMRPAQYRPDIVLRVREAMLPENLWSPDYKPTPIQREASRRLIRIVKALEEEADLVVIPEIDAPTSGEEEESTPDPVADTPAEEAPAPQPIPTPEPAAPIEEFMIMG